MKWTKLTSTKGNRPVYVNIEKATHLERSKDDSETRIYLSDGEHVDVTETPDEVLKP